VLGNPREFNQDRETNLRPRFSKAMPGEDGYFCSPPGQNGAFFQPFRLHLNQQNGCSQKSHTSFSLSKPAAYIAMHPALRSRGKARAKAAAANTRHP
jgi:hypothetical protein